MNQNWLCIYTTQQEYKAEIVKGVLENEGIKCFSLSKKDYAYAFGEIELYVSPDDVLPAKRIIEREKL
ncbi:MAG: putative signal transducing protein [Bacteroidales bacterium]